MVQLADKHLKGSTPEETRWKDSVSHFVLRLAYCRRALLPAVLSESSGMLRSPWIGTCTACEASKAACGAAALHARG